MKPSKKPLKKLPKKQNKLGSKKINENGSDSVPLIIQSFFKAAPKSFVVENTNFTVEPNNGDRQFYVDLLKSKLESYPDDETVFANENVNDERDEDVEQLDSNRKLEMDAPETHHSSKNSSECAGCVQLVQITAERDEFEGKYKQECERRKKLEKVYLNLNIEFSELYMKHQSLLKAKGTNRNIAHVEAATGSEGREAIRCASTGSEATGCASVGGVATGCVSTGSEATVIGSEATVCVANGGNDTFTEPQLKFLRFVPLDKRNDCTFILQCLKYAYKSDLTVLASRTLKGRSERTEITDEGVEIHHEGKAPLTPEKVDRIKTLFVERISKCEIDSDDFMERMKDTYVNKLFAAGIGNLSKKPK